MSPTWGCRWHWGWRDIGVPKVWDVGGIGVGSDVGGIGVGGTLVSPKWGTSVALGSKGRWCVPKMGVLVALRVEVALVAVGLGGQ